MRIGFVILVALSLMGCLRVETQISSFSSFTGGPPLGETFYILPNRDQQGSAEFRQYAGSIARRLEARGWSSVESLDEAKFVVSMNYGVGGSTEVVSSVPIYGQTGGGMTTHMGTVYGSGGYGSYSGTSYTAPTYGVIGASTVSTTNYQRYFNMRIQERDTREAVYETSASSTGSSATFGQVAECIFDAAFKDFPDSVSGVDVRMMDGCGEE